MSKSIFYNLKHIDFFESLNDMTATCKKTDLIALSGAKKPPKIKG
jgi:hypothetical protein